MKRNTKKNREKLAKEIVDQMDLDAIIELAREQHDTYYESLTNKEFTSEWKEVFGKE